MSAATATPGTSDTPAGDRLRGRPSGADVAVIAGPVVLAGVLCLISLTGRSLGFDEGATVAIVSQHGAALWRAIARDGGNMSGYYQLMHVLVGAFGDGPWVLRLPSVVFAAITPGIIAALALALWKDRRPAILAAVLSVDLALVYWAQTARGYAAMVCFACASMLAFVRLAQAQRDGRPWTRTALWYVLWTACAAYCGFIVLLIVPVQVIGLVRLGGDPRPALRRFAGPVVAVAVLCLPLVVLALSRGSGQLFWVPRPNQQVDSQVMQSLSGSGLQSTFHRTFTTTAGWIATAVVMLALVAYVVAAALRGRGRPRTADDRLAGWGTQTVLVWLILPWLVTFLVSLVAQPLFMPRNLLAGDPALALALAAVLCDRRLPRWLAGAGIALALFIRAVPLAAAYGVSPEPWSTASARVLAAARPGDCVAFYPEDGRNVFRWYVTRAHASASAPRSVLPATAWSATRPYVELYRTLSEAQIRALAPHCRRLWFISSHEGQQHGPPIAVRHREEWLAFRARLQRVFGRGPVVSLGWASVIHVELMSR